MLNIKIAGSRWKFKNKFDEITVKEFSENVRIDHKIDAIQKAIDEHKANIAELEKIGTMESQDDQMDIDIELAGLIMKSRMQRIHQISRLCNRPNECEDFLLTTKGIDAEVLGQVYNAVNDCFDRYEQYFAELPGVKSFRFNDYKPSGLFRLKRSNFHVADLSNQTLLRDSAAIVVAQKIGNFRIQSEAGNWDQLAKFCAFVCRPKREKYEYMPGQKWYSFIGGERFESLSAPDRLTMYNQNLENTVQERTSIFEDLPIAVALGIYKYYFILKKKSLTNTKSFMEIIKLRLTKQSSIKGNLAQKQV